MTKAGGDPSFHVMRELPNQAMVELLIRQLENRSNEQIPPGVGEAGHVFAAEGCDWEMTAEHEKLREAIIAYGHPGRGVDTVTQLTELRQLVSNYDEARNLFNETYSKTTVRKLTTLLWLPSLLLLKMI